MPRESAPRTGESVLPKAPKELSLAGIQQEVIDLRKIVEALQKQVKLLVGRIDALPGSPKGKRTSSPLEEVIALNVSRKQPKIEELTQQQREFFEAVLLLPSSHNL